MRGVLALSLLLCLVVAVVGKEGCSLSLDGSNRLVLDQFVIGFPSGISLPSGTFEAWIKPAKHGSSTGVVFQTGTIKNGEDQEQAYVLSYDYTAKSIKVDVYSTGKHQDWALLTLTSKSSVHPDQWTHVAFHLTASLGLFINGKVAACDSVQSPDMLGSPKIEGPSRRLAIGTQFVGEIDEVKLWKHSLSTSEISKHMKSKPCSREDLALYLPFDECTGNITADLSISAACGRIKNQSTWDRFRDRHHNRGWMRYGWKQFGVELHPIPFFLDNSIRSGVDMIDLKKREERHGGGDRERPPPPGPHDHPHPPPPEGKGEAPPPPPPPGKGGVPPPPPPHEWSHKKDHKHGNDHHKWCRQSLSIVFGSPSPAVSECAGLLSVNVSEQCPYSSVRPWNHHSSSSSSSDSESSYDSSSSDWTSEDSEEADATFSFVWMSAFGMWILSCAALCCRRKQRANNTPAYTQLGGNVQTTTTHEDYAGYPGAHVEPQPVFASDMVSMEEFQLQQQHMYMQYMMYPPPHMMVGGGGVQGEGVGGVQGEGSYAYYMPQPVYYAPNLE